MVGKVGEGTSRKQAGRQVAASVKWHLQPSAETEQQSRNTSQAQKQSTSQIKMQRRYAVKLQRTSRTEIPGNRQQNVKMVQAVGTGKCRNAGNEERENECTVPRKQRQKMKTENSSREAHFPAASRMQAGRCAGGTQQAEHLYTGTRNEAGGTAAGRRNSRQTQCRPRDPVQVQKTQAAEQRPRE
jgi:hypothetical protein